MKPRQIVLYATFVLLLGVAIGRLPQMLARFSDDDAWAGALDDTRRLIRDKYVEPVDEKALIRAGIEGMVGSLNDPYTEFVAPADEASFEQALTGKYAGIGARIDVSAGTLQGVAIQTPMEGSPALAAGLRPGDRIVEIEGSSTLGEPFDSSIAKLKGEPGTAVTVRVRRPVWDARALESVPLVDNVLDPRRLPTPALSDPFPLTITRAALSDRSVKGLYFDNARSEWSFDIAQGDQRVAYIRIEQFTDRTAAEFKAALLAAGAIGPSGDPRLPRALVIDVRDNPGGLLNQAVEVADLFLSEGVIVSTKRRGTTGPAAPPTVAEITRADARAIVPASLPVIILINERSASASEIFAGALKDNGRAIVLGHRSFGKGLVQTIEPLPTLPGALLKLTEQRFYLPGGQMIHRITNATQWGVDPTPGYEVENDEATGELGASISAALDIIRPKPSASSPADARSLGDAKLGALFATLIGPDAWSTPQRIKDRIGDAQLAGAVEAINKRLAASESGGGGGGGGARWVPLKAPQANSPPVLTTDDRERQVLERTQIEIRAQLARLEQRLTQLRTPPGTSNTPAPANPPTPPPPAPSAPETPR